MIFFSEVRNLTVLIVYKLRLNSANAMLPNANISLVKKKKKKKSSH